MLPETFTDDERPRRRQVLGRFAHASIIGVFAIDHAIVLHPSRPVVEQKLAADFALIGQFLGFAPTCCGLLDCAFMP
jgi:hypothetical protein